MSPGELPEAKVIACLDKILGSAAFGQAERLREFLRFTVQQSLAGESASLKETVIGVAVFGRDPGYDPKADNIVRTAARRVRAKLAEYYESDGRNDPLRIDLPKGSYIPVFEPVFETKLPELPPAPAPRVATAALTSERRPRRLIGYGTAAAIIITTLLAVLFITRTRSSGALWHSVPFTSASGYETFPAFSPDGTRIAFTWGGPEDGPRQVYIQAIGSQSAQPLTTGPADKVRPAWSPDGKQVAFVQLGIEGNKTVFAMLASGQIIRQVTRLTGRGVWLCNEPRLSWSPTGAELVSVEETADNHACGVVVFDSRSGVKRALTRPPGGILADVEPAFSPDGRFIAFLRQSSASIGDIFVMSSAGGHLRQVTFDHREIRGFTWTADSKSLIVCSRRRGDFLNLWQFPLEGRNATRLTEGPVSLGFPSSSTAGDRIAYVAYLDDINIWRLSGESRQPWIESRGQDWSPQYSPDGTKIAFTSDRAGNLDVWLAGSDGRNPVRLTNLSPWPAGSPSWSPDGRRLAFDVRVQGHSFVYVINAQPGNEPYRPAKWQANEAVPSWSRDGRFLYFAASLSGTSNIYRVPAEGGNPVAVTHDGGFRALESFDGRYLYCTRSHSDGLWRVPLLAAGKEEAVLPHFPESRWASWTLGKDGVYYLEDDPAGPKRASFIKLYSLDSGKIMVLGRSDKFSTGGLAVSSDGKSILYCQRDQSGSDVLLLEH